MSTVEIELHEFSALLDELRLFSEGIKKIDEILPKIMSLRRTKYRCLSCGFESIEKIAKCPSCGRHDRFQEIFEVDETQEASLQYGFNEEAMRIWDFLIQWQGMTTRLISQMEIFKLVTVLPNASNYPLERKYIQAYFMLNYSGSGAYKRDIEYLKIFLSFIAAHSKSENVDCHLISQFRGGGKNEALYLKTLTLLFSDPNYLMNLLQSIEKKINLLKESSVMKDIYSLCKRNLSMTIHPGEINPFLSGKMTVIIRHASDESDSQKLKPIFETLLKGIETYGSSEAYYAKMANYIKQTICFFINKNYALLYHVYGRKIDVTIFIDIQYYKNAAGFVREWKNLLLHNKEVCVVKSDESLRTLEINIQASFLFECIKGNKSNDLANILVHELGHLFDKNIKSNCPIRDEGVATFTEFAYGQHCPQFHIEVINDLMEHPLAKYEDYVRLEAKWAKQDEISLIPYWLGEYSCFVIYLALLKRRYPQMDVNIFNIGPLWRLALDKETGEETGTGEYAKTVLKLIRNMSKQKFFYFYFKYSNELHLKPIFTVEFVSRI
ncbi:MAG: hypothetical protein ABIJ21_03475 [Nanoarchaeota archaeon]